MIGGEGGYKLLLGDFNMTREFNRIPYLYIYKLKVVFVCMSDHNS